MSKNGEAANAQPVEQKGPQAGPDDQPLHTNSDNLRSHDQLLALVAESKAKVRALSPEELRARWGGPVRGVSPARAMDILDELERDDEASESEEARGGKPEVTEDNQDDQYKTAPGAGGAQDEKEKAAEEKQESEVLSASKS
ncbi:hypothetical protein J7T55_010598 [Diaporthe amygdali]|uniref:uncharacterized protein n=1 Tax=Phomopsis amygdali TaxID=1214568 RepID=UPI0022FEDD4E|nr:uncharacterized protein J7T55_010598 [Diaporthe amygdali]KAJ0115775.1 hypothetical protein J7T55_010598 [Diaporthe amygdali]